MKKIALYLIITCLFVSCTHKLYNSSSWQSKPVTVDGEITEWPNPLRFYDQETGISYSISNDHNNLYFYCSISNEFLQIKILSSGLDFGIDTLGKKSSELVLSIPSEILKIKIPEKKIIRIPNQITMADLQVAQITN